MIPEKKLLRIINQELDAGNPSWQIIVNRRDWLCPFCGEVGAERLRMEESLELRIAQHLRSRCPSFGEGDSPALDSDTLERRQELVQLKRKIRRALRREPRWQVVLPDGRWICPYCVQPTDHRLGYAREVTAGRSPSEGRLDRDVAASLRHLHRCDAYLDQSAARPGSLKGMHPLEEMLDARNRLDLIGRAEHVRERLRREPVWRLRDMERRWLCPFCARTTSIAFHRDQDPSLELAHKVALHTQSCGARKRLNGKPRTERYLKDRIIAINREHILERLRRKLRTHAIWQVSDMDDEWYCPYCAQSTGVSLPEPQSHGVSAGTLNQVWEHLSSCPSYRDKRAQLKAKSTILQAVAVADRRKRRRREARRALLEDPRFAVHDAFGSWLCPYCRKVQKRINVSTDPRLLDKTTEQVVSHLNAQCTDYADGQPPTVALEALLARVEQARRPRPVASARDSGAPSAGGEGGDGSGSGESPTVPSRKHAVELSKELEQSLEDARSRQLHLLPELPEIPGFEFAIVYQPVGRVGGDFYDFFRVGSDELGIAVGDVAGHGIEAALLVGLAKKLIEIHARGRSSPGQALLLANADIYPDLDARTFVTVFLANLNTRTRGLRFSRAGHNPLVLFNPARRPRMQVLDSKGMALGMDAGPIFQSSIEEVELGLREGDLLVQYTDGVVEATNHDREEFGIERLYAVIERYGAEEAEYVLYQVERALRDFREGARQSDDVTLLALKVTG